MALTERQRRQIKFATAAVGFGALAYLLSRLSRGAPTRAKTLRTDAPGWQRSQALIDKLHPSIQPMARQTLSDAWEQGVSLTVTQGLRTMEEQQALYDQGRTKPGAIVTNARPGDSWHNHGLAFDVAIFDGGKPSWPNDSQLWAKIGAIGKANGLTWGGEFKSILDLPHFEFHPGMTLAEAKSGKRPAIA